METFWLCLCMVLATAILFLSIRRQSQVKSDPAHEGCLTISDLLWLISVALVLLLGILLSSRSGKINADLK